MAVSGCDVVKRRGPPSVLSTLETERTLERKVRVVHPIERAAQHGIQAGYFR